VGDIRVVITGAGVVTPAGRGLDNFWANITKGGSFVREIDRFDASRYRSRHAALVEGFDPGPAFSKRLTKKLDLFSLMSLAASEDALKSASIDMAGEDPYRVGVVFGNALGGWGFAEVELRKLYTHGLREVSPYQATAWFPAAPQGQVSIHYGIKGFAKTVISDIASSHLAIACAVRAIRTGRADVVLAGGTEAPVSPYALLCLNSSGELSHKGAYMPFDRRRDGYVVGEGAAVLVVEEYGRAVARGANILAEVKGFGHTSDGADPVAPLESGDGMERAMRIALRSANVEPAGLDYLIPACNGGVLSDRAESNAVNRVFGESIGDVAVGMIKPLIGNTLGASGAIDAALGCLAIQNGVAPRGAICEDPIDGAGWVNGGAGVEKNIKRVMINSMGRGGVHACLILERPA